MHPRLKPAQREIGELLHDLIADDCGAALQTFPDELIGACLLLGYRSVEAVG
jgi:hypothetical protein